MLIFDDSTRVEKIKEGLKFYEQDILSCSYIFEQDITINLKLDYVMSGFGIVLIEDNGNELNNTDIAYLFKIGSNTYTVIEKNFLLQKQLQYSTCLLAPSQKNINLKFTYENNEVSIDWIYDENTIYNLGKTILKKKIGRYKIGFYSSKDNILKDVSFIQGVPRNWNVSIKNTRGGRISFEHNGFKFENCKHDAEIEQQHIKLKKGTYYLSYDKERINNEYNIDCFVFPTNLPEEIEEQYFEDEAKNLLDKNNILNIPNDMDVNLKFKGNNGKILNIAIKDDINSGYVETEDKVVTMNGSYMTVILSSLKQIRWRGLINSVPSYIDLTKPCPYAIIETINHRTTLEEANINLKQEYGFIFNVKDSALSICDISYKKVYKKLIINITEEDNNRINVFRNMNAYIYELIITKLDGEEINILVQKTYKKYVTSEINGPILVTKEDKKSVLDLSSSYREISEDIKTFKMYSTQYNISVPKYAPFLNYANLKIYAIPDDAIVDLTQDTIDKCVSSYYELNHNEYHISNDSIILEEKIKNVYPSIILEYISTNSYSYIFTNYEREIFDNSTLDLVLEKEPLELVNGIVVYGILNDSEIKDFHLYRIPNNIINSIDYYADKFNIISNHNYVIDYDNNEIKINKELLKTYKQFVVDYLKNDSYCINYKKELDQYEVDIATNEDKIYVAYNMREDGSMHDYKITEISPDKNKYIILRKE